MSRWLLRKAIHESRLTLLGCGAVMYGFCWVYVWLGSQLELDQLADILENFRQFERFFPVPFDQIVTYTGRIALCYDEPLVVFTMAVWAITRGSDCVSGELGRGTLEMLLAQPVTRLQIVATQAAVNLVGAGILATAAWLGTCTGVMLTQVAERPPRPAVSIPWLGAKLSVPDSWLAPAEPVRVPMSTKVDPHDFWPAAANLFALGCCLIGLTMLCSAWDRYRWRTIGLMVGLLVVQIVLKVLAQGAESLAWLEYLTIFAAYEPEYFVSLVGRPGGATVGPAAVAPWLGLWGCCGLLVSLGLLAIALGGWVFQRRDLPAPL